MIYSRYDRVLLFIMLNCRALAFSMPAIDASRIYSNSFKGFNECLCKTIPKTAFPLRLFDYFLSNSNFSIKTLKLYTYGINNFKHWYTTRCQNMDKIAPLPISSDLLINPTKRDIESYRAFLLSQYAPTTAQSYLTVVRLFFRWTEWMRLYPNVAFNIKSIRVERNFRRDALECDEAKHLLKRLLNLANDPKTLPISKRIKENRNCMIIMLMICCGLRVSEISKLDVKDFYRSGKLWLLKVQGKGRDGKVDSVIVPDQLAIRLSCYLQKNNLQDKSPMFPSMGKNRQGKRLVAASIGRIVKSILIWAGFDSPRITAHSLRHTAVTLALTNGANLQQAMQFARHSRIETTLIYAHNLERRANPCSRLVARMVMMNLDAKLSIKQRNNNQSIIDDRYD